MFKLLAVAFGGSVGAVMRYLIFYYFERFHKSIFPWPTLIVNLLGALIIGLLWGYFDRVFVSTGLRMFIFIGILGSFTTFSTFAFDMVSMIHDGQFRNLIAYFLVSNILGLGLAYAGFYFAGGIK
jgi:fluoride exporter